MIYKPPGKRYYMVKFQWSGRTIRKSTRATDRKTARTIEARLRVELARDNWNVLEAKPQQTLSEFLKSDFLPFTETRFRTKPATLEYYRYGAKALQASDAARLRLNEVTDQHAGQFAASRSHLSPSTINCGLRTLRRALALAAEWGKLDRKPKISLAKGERQRERVLTQDEVARYLAACPQPWQDAATVMLGTGMRPGEVYTLRWEFVLLNGSGGFIHVSEGKSRAARRLLPMIPEVYEALKLRHETQGSPAEGWVFPSESKCGHLVQGTAKSQHTRAITRVNKEAKENNLPELRPFPVYTMRHTALTRLAEAGCDAFTLARIAGHSSITITQRYCHPQADAIERAFASFARQQVVTHGGHLPKMLESAGVGRGDVTETQ